MGEVIRIVIVDDHPLFLDGVAVTLSAVPRLEVVGKGRSKEEAISLSQAHRPHVMLLDISMPGNGLTALKEIVRHSPDTRVVMLSVSESEEHVSKAFDLGAMGYVTKGASSSELVGAVMLVAENKPYVSPSVAGATFMKMRQSKARKNGEEPKRLSWREDQILELVSQGMTNKEVSNALKISEKTVKHYMTAIMEKLQVRNRVEAAVAVHRLAQSQAAASGAREFWPEVSDGMNR